MDPAIVRSSEDDLMDTLLATNRAHRWHAYTPNRGSLISHTYIYTREHEICFRIEPRHPPLNANGDFLRNCSCTQAGRLAD